MVKQAAGWFMQPRRDAARPHEPQRMWVYRSVLSAILDGSLPPSARLASARQFAGEWGVTRGAVDEDNVVGKAHALGFAKLAQVRIDDLAQELVVVAEAVRALIVEHPEHEV